MTSVPSYRLSIAPMMEYTDRNYRYFLRRITRNTLLYTEMITTGAIIHGDRDFLLGFDSDEHPISLQLGGDDPQACAESVRIAADYGYDEFNLNVGCPSERVQVGSFGACLMADPDRVARIVDAMKHASDRPVTVKHRIGINGRERYEQMVDFVRTIRSAGVDRVIVHARIAVLGGLSPKENRTVPPIRYDDVYRLKSEMPDLIVEINGQIMDMVQAAEHLRHTDGAMVGRAAYDNPWIFAGVDHDFYGQPIRSVSRAEVIEQMIPYIERRTRETGKHARSVLRHMLGLFAFQPGARRWKRLLSGPMDLDLNVSALLREAVESIPAEVLIDTGCTRHHRGSTDGAVPLDRHSSTVRSV